MTTHITDPVDVPQERIDTSMASMRGELARSDTKSSLLLALNGGALVSIPSATEATQLSLPAMAVGGCAALAFVAAIMILLASVRPRLGTAGWPTWHSLPRTELAREVAEGQTLEEVQVVSGITRTKNLRIKKSVDCSYLGILLLAIAVAFALVG